MKIFLKMAFAVAALVSAPAIAQDNSPIDSNDAVQIVRRDANGVGTRGALPATQVFDGVGVGYATGASVTQITSRSTGVTINAYSGAITLVSAAGSTIPTSFTVTNNRVAATDTIVLVQRTGTDLYNLEVTAVAAGSFRVTAYTTGGTTTEAPILNFAVVRAGQ